MAGQMVNDQTPPKMVRAVITNLRTTSSSRTTRPISYGHRPARGRSLLGNGVHPVFLPNHRPVTASPDVLTKLFNLPAMRPPPPVVALQTAHDQVGRRASNTRLADAAPFQNRLFALCSRAKEESPGKDEGPPLEHHSGRRLREWNVRSSGEINPG